MAGNNAESTLIKLKIDFDTMYTQKEIALMLERSVRTIQKWSEVGLKSRRNGIVNLQVFKIGMKPYIKGKYLADFLNKTQPN